MSFFEYLASEKETSEESFRTASTEAIKETSDRFAAFVHSYGSESFDLINDQVEDLVQAIADRHGVGHRSSAITKAAWFGLQHNPLLEERKNWDEEDWRQHYEGLTGGPHQSVDPNALVHRPGLDRQDPNQPPPRQLPALRAAGKDESTPSPKMDKRKWTPKTVGPLKGVDDPKGPHPTKHLDAVVPHFKEDGTPIPQATDKTKLEDIGEQVTERYDLNRDKQK